MTRPSRCAAWTATPPGVRSGDQVAEPYRPDQRMEGLPRRFLQRQPLDDGERVADGVGGALGGRDDALGKQDVTPLGRERLDVDADAWPRHGANERHGEAPAMADADARPGAARCAIGATEDGAAACHVAQREASRDPAAGELDQPRAAQVRAQCPARPGGGGAG